MIRVTQANEPASFHEHVRKRGADAINRLLGKPVVGRGGRKPKTTYACAQDIPSHRFPAYWVAPRPSDGKSALDDMMESYGQQCAYLAMRIEQATGTPTIDHFVPKSRDWRLVYEWSNYRLSAACVNAAKGVKDVVDPFKVGVGWFELDLDTFRVVRGAAAPPEEHDRIHRTLEILNQRECVMQRGQHIRLYREGMIGLEALGYYAPFIAAEFRRQGRIARGGA